MNNFKTTSNNNQTIDKKEGRRSDSLQDYEQRIYCCTMCDQQTSAFDMKAPRINRKHRRIPTDQHIVEKSLCKWCAPDEACWMLATIKYARQARQNKVEYVTRRMNAILNGDPKIPEIYRRDYLRNTTRKYRAQRALEIYEEKIATDPITQNSTCEELFYASERAYSLLVQAKCWVAGQEYLPQRPLAEKREARIRARIQNGKYLRASNTLEAAVKEFPWYDWSSVDLELRQAIERNQLNEDHRQKILTAIRYDDCGEVMRLTEEGEKKLPGIDWEAYALEQMDG